MNSFIYSDFGSIKCIKKKINQFNPTTIKYQKFYKHQPGIQQNFKKKFIIKLQ